MFPPTRLLLAVFLLTGCASSYKRNPVPEHLAFEADIPGLKHARIIGLDDVAGDDEEVRMALQKKQGVASGLFKKPFRFLAISGGGANGAFGAGLLCGWTEAGDRPEFFLVTGISTGALIAPFVFLGPEYDYAIREVYTTISTKDVVKKRGLLKAILSDAFADSAPLRELIAGYGDAELVAAIAREQAIGRRLYRGTTNLDLMEPVMWSIGAMAESSYPDKIQLIRDLMLASASIPGAFPPVYIKVVADGQTYDEMHVDGGATAQVFLYPLTYDMDAEIRAVGGNISDMRAYVIRNSRLDPDWQAVGPGIFDIMGRSIAALIHTQGTGDLMEIYVAARRDKIDFNLAYIPSDFNLKPNEAFDPVYMGELFDRGYEMAKAGYPWEKTPPDFEVIESD